MLAGGRSARVFVFALLVGSWLAVGVARAAQPLGALTQLAGTAGCFTYNGSSEDGPGTCSQPRAIADGESAAVSPDGANVYVGSYPNSGVSLPPSWTVFSRNAKTGALTQLPGTAGCLTPDGSSSAGGGTCTEARGLIKNPGDGRDVTFTSDGRWVYMVAQNQPPHSAVLIFKRDSSTGALTQLAGAAGCITSDGSDQDGAGQCQSDPTLNGASGISISSDDRFVYVVDYDTPKRIHVFSRNPTMGGLAEVQCISEAPAPVGCSTGRVLGNSESLALSPDGTHAYGGDYESGISIFDRDPTTGLLKQKPGTAGCITDTGKDNTGASTCTVGRVVNGTYALLVAPNGGALYDTAGADHGFSVFHINANGTLTQLSGSNGCTTINGKDNTGASTCTAARAVAAPYGGALSPDGENLYISEDTKPAGGVAVFSLDSATGVATQLPALPGCITGDGSSNGTAGQCTNGRALGDGYGMSVSPDGSSLYQATDQSSNAGLAVYAREVGPVCQSTSVATPFGKPVILSLSCNDADGDSITQSIVAGPSHGTLSAIDNSAGTVTYTPAAGFNGTDSFTFAASDGVNHSATATATITVGPQPSISSLRISPSKFSRSGRKVNGRCVKATKRNSGKQHCRRPIRLRVSYALNLTATVTFTLKREAPGRKLNGRCVRPTRRNHKHRKCIRLVKLHGHIVTSGEAGANRLSFRGKIGGHALGPGTYQLIATPTGGKPRIVTFRILR